MARVSIHIVAWNSMRFLPEALASIAKQTYRDFSVIVVDNASTDGIGEWLRSTYPNVIVLQNRKNLGFARGHNQAIALARSLWERHEEATEPYAIVMNPDIVLTPTFLEEIVKEADENLEAGSLCGKLYKIERPVDADIGDPVRTTVLDTTGIKLFRSGRVADRGAGDEDRGQYNEARDIFGPPGALALYRVRALEDVRQPQEYFDERFFAYKEDIDLAWRLRLRGWSARFAPEAVAYHYRSAYGAERRGLLETWRQYRNKSSLVNYYSYRNHLWLLWKNLDWSTGFLYALWMVPYELAKALIVLLFQPKRFRLIGEVLGGMPEMMKKRREIMARRAASPSEIRKWFRPPPKNL